jgi:integrase
MVTTAACLGLRVSELLGLQWGDIDFQNLTVTIQRSVVGGQVYPTKTEASQGMLPLAPELAKVLLAHRAASTYVAVSDFCVCGRGRESALERQYSR